MAGPEGDRILHVNMTDQTTSFEDFPAEWQLLGGRGLSAKILNRDCDPTCDPLGPDNVLVMAPGVLSGTTAPTSGRISIGCKSPLTGGIILQGDLAKKVHERVCPGLEVSAGSLLKVEKWPKIGLFVHED